MKFSELQKAQRMAGLPVTSADERIAQLEAERDALRAELDALKRHWRYDPELSAVVYVGDNRVKVAADFGKILDGDTFGHLIALMHNNLPSLLEAVEAIPEVIRISDRKHDAWDRVKAALEKLK